MPADLDKLHSVKRIVGNPYGVGKPGEFDQIWEIVPRKGEPPIRVIPEAKGGTAGRGSRKGADGFKRYEQGHPEYKKSVLRDIEDQAGRALESGDREKAQRLLDLVDKIREAEAADRLVYVQVRTGFKAHGPAGKLDKIHDGLKPKLDDFEVGEFTTE